MEATIQIKINRTETRYFVEPKSINFYCIYMLEVKDKK